MPSTPYSSDPRIAGVGDILREELARLGDELKDRIIQEFEKVLSGDLESLRDVVIDIVRGESSRVLSGSEQQVQNAVLSQFGGQNIFSQAAGNLFSSSSNGVHGGIVQQNNGSFSTSSGQQLTEMAKVLQTALARNG